MKLKLILALLLFFISHVFATVQPTIAQAKQYAKNAAWAFEENKGQVEGKEGKKVKYFYKQGNLTMFLMNGRLAYQFEKYHYPEGYHKPLPDASHEELETMQLLAKKIKRETYRMDIELIGANQNCEIISEGKSKDYLQYYNYDALDVHAYQKITYKNIYPNIDWVIYQSQDQSIGENKTPSNTYSKFKINNSKLIKYDFVVHPGGDPSDIKLRTHWVEDLNIKTDGSLTLVNRMGSITENPPVSFQDGKAITTQFKREGNTLGFHLADYDKNQILTIDPSIAWSTHYGGTGDEVVFGIKADSYRNAYMGGSTASSTFIASGGHLNTYSGASSMDFLVKFNRDGRRLWATYYPGESYYSGGGVSVDSTGNTYLVGTTRSSSGVATAGSFQTSLTAPFAGYIVKFNPNGTRLWGTYYNGFATHRCDVGKDNLLVVGSTISENASTNPIATAGTHKQTHSGGNALKLDIFIAKFDENGSRLWATYYGGAGNEFLNGLAIDNLNYIVFAGNTSSFSGIALNGFIDTFTGTNKLCGSSPSRNGFLTKFNNQGQQIWGTYFPNIANWCGTGGSVATDNLGNVYFSTDLEDSLSITSNYNYTYANGKGRGLALLKFNSNGQRLWGRFLTDTNIGGGFHIFRGLDCDEDNNIYGAGFTTYIGGTYAVSGGFQLNKASIYEGYVAKYNENGDLVWGSFFGGKGSETMQSLSVNKKGELFFAGYTDSVIPTIRPFQTNHNGGFDGDAFAVKLCGLLDTPKIEISSNRGTSICGGGQVIFTATDTFEGDDPAYTWYKNGSPIGMDTNTLTMASIQDKDSFRCRLISSATCLFKDTVWSNTLVMKIKAADTYSFSRNICELKSYRFNNQNLTTSGTYRDTFTSSAGCDSFVFLHLLVKDTSLHEFTYVTPCDSVSHLFDGIFRTQPGRYTALDTNALGCDSTTILNLFFRKPTHTRLSPVQICPNSYYVFADTARTKNGDYIRYYTNTDGCPSTDSLRITVLNNPTPQTNPIPACAPFTFRGKTYTSSATVMDTIKTSNGLCDSIILSNLLQLKTPAITASDINHIICDSIRLNNRLFTSSFSFIDTFRTSGAVQCDSVYRKTNYTIRSTPQIGLKERDTFMRGSQVTLKPFSATNYLWSTGQTTKDISFKLTEDRQLYLIAWNEEPCRDTAYISLVAEDLAIVGMPTGFSPTGEHSENRTLKPNINGRLEYFHMMVFNRWGEKVYETFDTQPQGWNGIFKGEPAPSGLYGYVMEYRTLGSIFTKSGEVMLVR